MKIYKVNSLTTILFAFLTAGLVLFLPIVLIEALWNGTIGKTYTDISINLWQALILWLIVLVLLNILGVFKFEFAVETLDKELIKKKLKSFKNKADDTEAKKPEHINEEK